MQSLAELLPTFALKVTQPKRKKASGKRYRRDSIFVRDTAIYRQHFDRNQKHRILLAMERGERISKLKGDRRGSYGRTGLDVFKALLLELADARGLRAPAIATIMKRLNVSRQTVVAALQRLEDAGRIKRIKRIRRVLNEHGVVVTIQDTNIYVISAPEAESSYQPGKKSYCLERSSLPAVGLQGSAEKEEKDDRSRENRTPQETGGAWR